VEQVRRRPGPVPRLSREAVLAVARDMTPEETTLSAIGAELGVTGPALYRYFPDRTAILEALAHEAREKLVPPAPGLPWEQWLLEAARAERGLWRSHGNLYEEANYRAISRPALQMTKVGLQVMKDAGFRTVDAACGLTAVTELAHAIGFAESHRDTLLDPEDRADLRASLQDVEEPLTPDLVFERSVALVIEGLRLLLRTTRSRKPSLRRAST
jgi:AcrR family transcriptional regulator